MAELRLARFLAPLALVAAVIGVILVVLLSTGSNDPAPAPSATHRTNVTQTTPAKHKARAYVVKSGDSLTAIAVKTGVSLETLERLNPDADPQALRLGERLKLTP
jgi:LysM repeat protein